MLADEDKEEQVNSRLVRAVSGGRGKPGWEQAGV